MRFVRLTKLFISLFLISCLSGTALADSKRRIAVFPFDYGTTSTVLGSRDIGNGVSSMLINKLVNDGIYEVVERQMINTLLKEQNFSVSDRANPETAIKLGKLLSVDAIITGSVTQFGFENSSKNIDVGGVVDSVASNLPFGDYIPFGGFGVGFHKSKAKVVIDARIIDCKTGIILGAVKGTGISKVKGSSLFGSETGNFNSPGFESSLAGEATMQAVNQLAINLNSMANKIPDNKAIADKNVTGKIAYVDENNVVVNVGSDNGLSAGDMFKVESPYKTVKDPDSGKIIEELYKTVGVIKLSSIHKSASDGIIVKGDKIQIGDKVSRINADDVASIQIDSGESIGSKVEDVTLTTKVEKLDSNTSSK